MYTHVFVSEVCECVHVRMSGARLQRNITSHLLNCRKKALSLSLCRACASSTSTATYTHTHTHTHTHRHARKRMHIHALRSSTHTHVHKQEETKGKKYTSMCVYVCMRVYTCSRVCVCVRRVSKHRALTALRIMCESSPYINSITCMN